MILAVLVLPGMFVTVDQVPGSGPSGSLSKSRVKLPVMSELMAFTSSAGGVASMPHPRNMEAATAIPILLHFMIIETSLGGWMRTALANHVPALCTRTGELFWKMLGSRRPDDFPRRERPFRSLGSRSAG